MTEKQNPENWVLLFLQRVVSVVLFLMLTIRQKKHTIFLII